MTFVPYPLDPRAPIFDSVPDRPAELLELPQRVRSWKCQTGAGALCRDSRCLCTCHSEAANVWSFDGFTPRPRGNGKRTALAETEHDLTGARNGFRLGYVGPTNLADLLSGRRRSA